MIYQTTVSERLALRRDQAWARSMMSRTSTLAGRAPAGVPSEPPVTVKPVALVLLAIALVFIWITGAGF